MAYALSLFGAVAVQNNTRDAMEITDAPRSARSVPPELD